MLQEFLHAVRAAENIPVLLEETDSLNFAVLYGF